MDHNKLRSLAGLPSLTNAEIKQLDEKLSDVKAKVEVPDGTFTKKAKSIVKTLVALHDGDKNKAMKALTFYINRAGKDVTNAEELEKAKAILKEDVDFIEANLLRARAGLPLLEKAESKDDESADEPVDDVPAAEEGKEKDEKSEEDDEDDLPSIVKKLAKKAVGKDEEALEDLLMKVYNAGFSDGQKAKEDESEESEEDKDSKKADKKEPKDDLTKDNE